MCSAPGDDDGPRVVAAVREEERTLRAGDGAPLREFVAQPATGFRRGAVLIIHDVWGYTDFYKDLARRITSEGHAALLVDFFGRQGDLPDSMRAPEKTGSKPEAVAQAVLSAARSDETGQVWVVQPGREPLQFRFPNVPGPRDASGASIGAPPRLAS